MTKPLSIKDLDQDGQDYLAGMQALITSLLDTLKVSPETRKQVVYQASAEGQRIAKAKARRKELIALFTEANATTQRWQLDNWPTFVLKQDQWADAVRTRFEKLFEPEDLKEMSKLAGCRCTPMVIPSDESSIQQAEQRLMNALRNWGGRYFEGRTERIRETRQQITDLAKYRAELVTKQMEAISAYD